MKLVRPALCLAVAASLLGGGLSSAATKPKPRPVCNLVTDAKGDASLTTAAVVPPNENSLDITSADIAGNAKHLTAAIRLADLATPKTAPFGFSVLLTFKAPTGADPLYFRYATSPLFGTTAEYGWDNPAPDGGLTPLGDAAMKLDAKKKEIRLTAPIKGFADQAVIKVGTKLTGLEATTSRDYVALLVYADRAQSTKSYVVGQPSCVIPGR